MWTHTARTDSFDLIVIDNRWAPSTRPEYPVRLRTPTERPRSNSAARARGALAQSRRLQPPINIQLYNRTMATFVFDHGGITHRPVPLAGAPPPRTPVMYGLSVSLAFTYASRRKYCRFLLCAVNQAYTRTDTILQSVDTVKYETYVDMVYRRAPSLEDGRRFWWIDLRTRKKYWYFLR